ncbi:hypothetical protein, partial [Flavobacterium sp.]|uniref:hypothetical protein n=1 Tax=Flavobacterium sp. TaxID=239 RepID=UPI0025B80C31
VRSRFWFSRKAFLLLLRPGKSSPAEGDELQHPAAKLPQTPKKAQLFYLRSASETISVNT